MRRVFSYFVIIGLLCTACNEALAIAVEDLPTSELPPSGEGYSFNWDYVYNYKGASTVAVDHFWILTAAHVADDSGSGSLVIDGETYTQQEVVLHSMADDPDSNETADIALVRYDKRLPGYYLLDDSIPVGNEILICGFGFSGNVVSTRFNAYFSEDNTSGHITKRWGTNKIDGADLYSSTVPIVATSKGFNISISKDRSNAGKTVYEAGCNIYDSGGGMFHYSGGSWKLTGHMVARSGAGPYTGNFALATSEYVNWIKSVITDYDTNMDGLPDWWESLYGGGATSMDPNTDSDNDGFTNFEEWLGDTIPTDENSFLQISGTTTSNLTFNSSSNRQYLIESRTQLGNSNTTWQAAGSWFGGSPVQTVQPVSEPFSNIFYRVRARL